MSESTQECKTCKRCGRVKLVSEFSVQGRGRRATCRACLGEDALARTCRECMETKPLDAFLMFGLSRRVCHPCFNAGRRDRYWSEPHRQGRERPAPPRPTPPVGHAWCTKCDACKPIEAFPRMQTGRGHGSWCKICVAAHNREQYKRPEIRADRMSRWQQWSAKNPAYHVEFYRRDLERSREKMRRAAAQRRARLNNLPVEPYTMAQLIERDGPWCVLCAEVIDFSVDHPSPLSPTVEHLECLSWPGSAGGDAKDNCALSHFSCNSKRGDRPHPGAARKRAELLAAQLTWFT